MSRALVPVEVEMTESTRDSKAMARARVELLAIARKMQTTEARIQRLIKRLVKVAETAEVLGPFTFPGKPVTAEGWLAGHLEAALKGEMGDPFTSAEAKAAAEHDWRAEALENAEL